MSGTDGDVGHSIAVVSPSYITGDHNHCIMIMFGIYNTMSVVTRTHNEGSRKAFSWLKVTISAFIFKTLF